MGRLRQMDTAEWGIVATGLAVAGFGLWILSATPHEPWRVIAYALVVVGGLAALLAFFGYPLFVMASVAMEIQAAKRGALLPASSAPVPRVDPKAAMRVLSSELKVARASVVRLVSEGKFPRGVTLLPTARWAQYEGLLAEEGGELYAVVSDAYVQVDSFNRMTVDRANLYASGWLSFHDDDDIEGLVRALAEAAAALDQAVA